MIDTDTKKIEEFLSRGVEMVYPSKEWLEGELKSGRQLSMYLGIDPTGPTLHLGHTITLRKMRLFQDLGHKIILLIGDFTAMIGDPTGKNKTRVPLTREQVLENAKLYKKQAEKIIRFDGDNPAEMKHNSEWSDNLTLKETMKIASNLTVGQMLERDMFQKRMEKNEAIHIHEFLYPMMQGYDTVAMDVDGEIGGNDQTFNMLTGRTLMKRMKDKEKFVISMKLLVDPTGAKMGKSEGNMITFQDSADEMFGKTLSWTDGMILPGFELLTEVSDEDITKMRVSMESGTNPKELKVELAKTIVEFFYSDNEADAAAEKFEQTFKEHTIPEDIPELKITEPSSVIDILVETELCSSKSDARRQIDGGGVRLGGTTVKGYEQMVGPSDAPIVLQKGKRHFVRIVKK